MHVNGQWKQASGESFSSIDPATGEIVWEGAAATADDIAQAVAAARAAFL